HAQCGSSRGLAVGCWLAGIGLLRTEWRALRRVRPQSQDPHGVGPKGCPQGGLRAALVAPYGAARQVWLLRRRHTLTPMAGSSFALARIRPGRQRFTELRFPFR